MKNGGAYASEISQGGVTLLAATIAYGSGSALFMYSANLIVLPLEKGTGWSRGDIALGLSMLLIVNAIALPIVGRLVDRFGPRPIGLASLAGYGGCCALLALNPFGLKGYYGVMLAISLFFPGTSAVVYARVVAARFVHLRGTALAVMYSGTAIILGLIAATLTSSMAERGFQVGYVMLGGIAILLGLPTALLAMRESRQDPAPRSRPVDTDDGLSLTQALRTPAFWQVSLAIFASASALGGILNQLAPVLAERGLSPAEVALMASLFAASVVGGRLLAGFLLDTLNPGIVAGGLMLAAALGILLLLQVPTTMLVCAIFVALIGCAMGAEADFAAFMSAHYFGRASYSAILGSVLAFISAGLAGSTYLYGTWYDSSGTYNLALQFSIAAFLVSSLIFASLYAQRPFARVRLAETLKSGLV